MDDTAVTSGAAGGVRPSRPLRWTRSAAEILLLVLGAGHLVQLPVAGAVATGTDGVIALLVLVWAWERVGAGRRSRVGEAGPESATEGWHRSGLFLAGTGVLLLFAGWVALSGTWGVHPSYAVAKGVGLAALGFAAAALGVVAVNGLFTASEDLRHVWMMVGRLGVAAAARPGAKDPG